MKRGFLDAEVTLETPRQPSAIAIAAPRLPRRRAPAREGGGRAYPCLKLDDVKTPQRRRPPLAQRDRRRDRQLPRRGAPRRGPRSGPRPARSRRHDHRARRAFVERDPPVAARSRPRRDVRPRHLRSRRAARAGALSERGVPPRPGRSRPGPRGASATRAPPRAGASRSRSRRHRPTSCTYDATGLPLPVAHARSRRSRAPPNPRAASSARRESHLRIPVKLGPRTVLYDIGLHRRPRAHRGPSRARD